MLHAYYFFGEKRVCFIHVESLDEQSLKYMLDALRRVRIEWAWCGGIYHTLVSGKRGQPSEAFSALSQQLNQRGAPPPGHQLRQSHTKGTVSTVVRVPQSCWRCLFQVLRLVVLSLWWREVGQGILKLGIPSPSRCLSLCLPMSDTSIYLQPIYPFHGM